MKTKYLILLFILITVQSCQQPKEVIRETVIVSDRSNQTGGTDQVGGGNGIDGVPLDAFIKDVDQYAAYKNKISPLIENLSQKFPRLAADFYHITHQRKWYFVPGKLDSISQNILGSYVPTDQIALQDTNKIWIDSLQFEKMNLENQSLLILHELMMGVGLLKYKYVADRCVAKAATLVFGKSTLSEYNDQKDYCRKTYPLQNIATEPFNPKEINYDVLRGLVSDLNKIDPDLKEIESVIKYNNIRDYSD